jgi:hypothetical protein
MSAGRFGAIRAALRRVAGGGVRKAALGAVAMLLLYVAARVVAAPGLLMWWPLDETSGSVATDSSGNGVSGTLQGFGSNPWQPSGGRVGGALWVNGTPLDSTVQNYVSATVTMTPSFTVSLWARSSTATWSENGWIASARGVNGFHIHPNYDTRTVSFRVREGGGNGGDWEFATYTPADITKWHLYTITFDNTTRLATAYVDGVAVGSATASFTRGTSSVPMTFGQDQWSNTRNGRGYIDDIRIYNGALSAAEVAALPGLSANASGLLTHLRLDETSGTTAADASGQDNAGTLVNMAGTEWTTAGERATRIDLLHVEAAAKDTPACHRLDFWERFRLRLPQRLAQAA